MRKKQLRVVVSFYTTAGAMATEQLCRREGLEGRLISVPRKITSDCGIAWSAPVELHPQVEQLLRSSGIEAAGSYELAV